MATVHRSLPVPRARQSGGALVEFALLLTLLITLIAGIVELGRTFWYYDALSKATRNGARALSASAKNTIASVAVDGARELVLADLASAGVPNVSGENIDIACLDATMTAITCADDEAPAGVRVSVVDYSMTLGKLVPFLTGASPTFIVNLKPSTTMPYMK
jgi:Flp pilus assembly protein TadG